MVAILEGKPVPPLELPDDKPTSPFDSATAMPAPELPLPGPPHGPVDGGYTLDAEGFVKAPPGDISYVMSDEGRIVCFLESF